MKPTHKIAGVIPSYKVARHIESIGAKVSHIYVIDDACPEESSLVSNNAVIPSSRGYNSPIRFLED